MEKVELRIADPTAAIRYLGEVQSRPLDAIHEPVQNLIDEGARRIGIAFDRKGRKVRIHGDAQPIREVAEARRILQSICESKKEGKLGEKGIGLLSFMNAGETMLVRSQAGDRHVWFRLRRDDLTAGEIGAEEGQLPFLPRDGTEIVIAGVPARHFRSRFATGRVRREIARRWRRFLLEGLAIEVDGEPVSVDEASLAGKPYRRTLRTTLDGVEHQVDVDLVVLSEPADAASVSVVHKEQANFDISAVPLFEGSVFTTGWLHGTITGDMAPINAARTGFVETAAFEVWQDLVMQIHDDLERLVAERTRDSAEARDQALIDEFMLHLRRVFAGTELSSVTSVAGPGDEEGWGASGPRAGKEEDETDRDREPGPTGEPPPAEAPERTPSGPGRKGGPGRLPTVPYGGFGEFAPSIRVWRDRKAFKINVKHPDYVAALKTPRRRRQYIRELCVHEAYIYSLEGTRRREMESLSDELMGYWTDALIRAADAQDPTDGP